MISVNKQDKRDIFLHKINTKNCSIYRLNKCLLKKRSETHPLIGSTAMVHPMNEEAESINESHANQFTPEF